MLRGRVISTTYDYDDQGRIIRSYASPAWTDQDHDLMIALAEYESSLCPGCGHPKEWAWHPGLESEGWFDVVEYTCQGCAKTHGHNGAVYKIPVDTWPADKPHPPWPDQPVVTTAPSLMPE